MTKHGTARGLLAIGIAAALGNLAGCDHSNVSSTNDWARVEAGWSHTCGVHEDGSVECWGDDTYGQATPPEGAFVELASSVAGTQDSPEHHCGLRDDGLPECQHEAFPGAADPP